MGRCAGAEVDEDELGAGTVGGRKTHSSAGGASCQYIADVVEGRDVLYRLLTDMIARQRCCICLCHLYV